MLKDRARGLLKAAISIAVCAAFIATGVPAYAGYAYGNVFSGLPADLYHSPSQSAGGMRASQSA